MAFQPGQQAYCQSVGTVSTANIVIFQRDPTPNDTNYPIGRFWLNQQLDSLFYLNHLSNASGELQATWATISVESLLVSLSGSDTPSVPVFASTTASPLKDNIQLTNLDGSMTITSDPGGNRIIFTSTSTGDIRSISGNTGGPEVPDSGGNFNLLGSGSIIVAGSANTETVQLTGLTNHNVLVGSGTDTITNVSPDTKNFVLTSNGLSADPSFKTVSDTGAITEIDGDFGNITPISGIVSISGGTSGLATIPTTSSTMAIGGVLNGDNGGTGVINSGLTIDLGSATAGYVLTSDVSGNATWQSASSSVTITGDDSVSLTGPNFNIISNVASNNSGATISFSGSGSTLTLNTTVNSNLFLGHNCGNTSLSGNNNVGVGEDCLSSLTTGNYNVCYGDNSGHVMTSAIDQIAIGQGALSSSQTDQDNVAIGTFAMASLNGGNANTGIGTLALAFNVTGTNNVGLGFQSLYHLTGGQFNFGLGSTSLTNLLTGSSNISIGYSSGSNYTGAESSNILINDSGVLGESNTLRISGINTSFINGIYGVTTTSATTSPVIISDGNQLGTIASSRRYKDNIIDIPDSDFMHKIRPVQFNYKAHKPSDITYGFIAEEVLEVAPQLVNLDGEGQPDSIKYHELYALLLKEIQDLRKELNELKNRGSVCQQQIR